MYFWQRAFYEQTPSICVIWCMISADTHPMLPICNYQSFIRVNNPLTTINHYLINLFSNGFAVARELNLSPETSPRTSLEEGAVNLTTHMSPLALGGKDKHGPSTPDDYELNLSTRHLAMANVSKSPTEVYDELDDMVPSDSIIRDNPMPLKVEISE